MDHTDPSFRGAVHKYRLYLSTLGPCISCGTSSIIKSF